MKNLEKRFSVLESELREAREQLRHIFKVNSGLISAVPCGQMYDMVTRMARGLLDTDMVVMRLFDRETDTLKVVSSFFVGKDLMRAIPEIKPGEALSGKAYKTHKVVAISDIDKDKTASKIALVKAVRKEGARAVLCVPIMFHDRPLGVLTTYCRKPRAFTPHEISLMRVFSSYVAVIIRESDHHRQMNLTYFSTISTLVLTLETRDPYTQGHTERVTKYALLIGAEMKLSQDELNTLRYASEIHDIGKISIPDFILNKPAKLNKLERSMIELHPVKGAQILAPLDFLKQVIPLVRHHHERYDGKGYPDGLKGKNIPLLARIMACADSYDAMTTERPYKQKMSIDEAIHEIRINSGKQFDPAIAALFIKILKSKKRVQVHRF